MKAKHIAILESRLGEQLSDLVSRELLRRVLGVNDPDFDVRDRNPDRA